LIADAKNRLASSYNPKSMYGSPCRDAMFPIKK
jgi:hypothetical protein